MRAKLPDGLAKLSKRVVGFMEVRPNCLQGLRTRQQPRAGSLGLLAGLLYALADLLQARRSALS